MKTIQRSDSRAATSCVARPALQKITSAAPATGRPPATTGTASVASSIVTATKNEAQAEQADRIDHGARARG